MYEIEFTRSAIEDLKSLKKSEQKVVTQAIKTQLVWEPITQTRNRKPLEANELSEWELRVGKFRIFYDVDTVIRIVAIKAVGWKLHNILYIRGKRFEL